MTSSFIQAIVLITDSSFISRYDPTSLAFDAVGNGGLLYVTVFMALVGMGDGAQILIARRIGQKQIDAVGRIFGTTVFTLFLIALTLFLLLQFVLPDALTYYSANKTLAGMQNDYIGIRSYALYFAMISLSIQAFFIANGKTWVVLIAALTTALSNVLMDYLMIFGECGFPELGLKGAAWASTIADGLGMLVLIGFLIFSKEGRIMKVFSHFSFNLPSMKELFKVGSPLMFQGFIALTTWTIFFTWLEQRGSSELTVSQNIRSIYFLCYVPVWGFAGTTKTYISQYIGRGKQQSLKFIQRRIQVLTLIFLFISFHGAIFYPETLIRMINPNEAYLAESAETLRFISGSIFMYGFFSVYFQTINGSGNTRITFLIEILCGLFYLCYSYYLIKVVNADIMWVWSNEYVYFGIMGLLSILYLKYFDWKQKEI
ncbi:MAG: MATE family efflux transporter [Flavobacteriia bacterium]|jgi:putative MATE family efflux protein